jgi:hypothetical protein
MKQNRWTITTTLNPPLYPKSVGPTLMMTTRLSTMVKPARIMKMMILLNILTVVMMRFETKIVMKTSVDLLRRHANL